MVHGNTLLDPTWNLTAARYNAKPENFCKSYIEIRKNDIDSEGKDHKCHQNDKLENEELINMDEKSLREVYKSLGYTREDGTFLIADLMDTIEDIDNQQIDMQDSLERRLIALKEYCPEFSTCINSTSSILEGNILRETENFKFNRCVINRVYNKDDPSKKANLFVYFESEDGTSIFYLADREQGDFVKMEQKEFEEQYECYEADKEKHNGKKIWESTEIHKKDKNTSSGEILIDED